MLHNFLGTVTSRYSEWHGYWLFGFVVSDLERLDHDEIFKRVRAFEPDFIVLTTAPTYLFWRCAPPELRVPLELSNRLRAIPGKQVIVGPHASTTPRATLRKLDADFVVLGECEEILPQLAADLDSVQSIAFRRGEDVITVAPRFLIGVGSWEGSSLELPEGKWKNQFTGEIMEGKIELGALLSRFPVALLTRVPSA